MISEVEEGEASYYQNGDETRFDPDVSLSYIDERIQDILGHFQKDFEGGVSAEHLGAKFGGYGSFLPTYTRSSACSQQTGAAEVIDLNIHKSPRILDPEVSQLSSIASSCSSLPLRLGAHSTASPKRNGSINGRVKGDGRVALNGVETPTSNGEQKSEFPYDQRTLKVRLRVGSNDLPARKNAEIYSGLGLDGSPSPSLNDSYTDTEWLPDDVSSPTSILKIMTSFLHQGTRLLSPLSEELMGFTQKEKYSKESVSKLSYKGKVNGYESRKDVREPLKKTNSFENSDFRETEGQIKAIGNQAQGEEQLCALGGNKPEGAQTHDSRKSYAPHERNNGSHVNGLLPKNGFIASGNHPKKITNKYQEFFGDLDYEHDDNKVSSKDVSSVKKLIDSKLQQENGSTLEDIRLTKENSEEYPRSSSLAEKHSNKPHKKSSLESSYVGGDGNKLKTRKKRQSDSDSSRSSKKVKHQDVLYNDENCMTAPAVNLVESGIIGLENSSPNQMPLKNKRTIDGHLKDEFTNHVTATKIIYDASLPNHNQSQCNSEDNERKVKKARTSNSEGKAAVTRKSTGETAQNDKKSIEQQIKQERGTVESVSSSPSGVLRTDKCVLTSINLQEKEDRDDTFKDNCSPRGDLGGATNKFIHSAPVESYVADQRDKDVSFVAGSKIKDENRSSSDFPAQLINNVDSKGNQDTCKIQAPESYPDERKDNRTFNGGSHSVKLENGTLHGNCTFTSENKSTPGCNDCLDVKLDMKESIQLHGDVQDTSNKMVSDIRSGSEISGSVKLNPLPPSVRLINHKGSHLPLTARPPKENAVDTSKAPEQNKKREKHNGSTSSRNSNATMDKDGSAVRKDSRSQAAANAMREATDLKRLADRFKNSGSADSTGMYFEAALKFLYGASLLESGKRENNKQNDIQCIDMYRSTAKFCEFCAHEYEKSKDMVSAALAYKCMEVSYMRVIYTSNGNANRDRNEVQMALQIVPPGESPASSASDVDNLNNPVKVDKVSTSKGMTSVQIAGNTGITAKNRSSFTRLLEFAQDVTAAMDATRKSRAAFTAANLRSGDGISSVKKALEFNFQDVDGLLRLIRIAKDALSR